MNQPLIKPRASIFLTTATATWNDMDDVRRACKGKPVRITGTTLDLNGCQLVGTRLPRPGGGEDDERSHPLRCNIPGLVIADGSVRAIPGGIVFRKPQCQFLDLDFIEIGEDALSNVMDDSPDARIWSCRFWGASDKSVQLNDARGLIFKSNVITGGITGVRLQKTGSKHPSIRTREVRHNRFDDLDTAWNLSGGVKVTATGNDYNNVRLRWKENNGATHTEK